METFRGTSRGTGPATWIATSFAKTWNATDPVILIGRHVGSRAIGIAGGCVSGIAGGCVSGIVGGCESGVWATLTWIGRVG
jgi:hypothetical protein